MSFSTSHHILVSVCAWCPKFSHPKLKSGEEYTHGICTNHLRQLRKELKQRRHTQVAAR